MTATDIPAEQLVIDNLRNTGPCFLDDLVTSLPSLTWSEVFTAVDRMSKDKRLWLRQVGYSTYAVIPYPHLFTPSFQIPPNVKFQRRCPSQTT